MLKGRGDEGKCSYKLRGSYGRWCREADREEARKTKKGASASVTTRTGALAAILKRSGDAAAFAVPRMGGGGAGAMWELRCSRVAYAGGAGIASCADGG